MSKAEELLNGIAPADTPSLYLARPEADNEPHIVVGNDRFITVPEELKRIAVQFDHNIETVTFDCPRYWDNHDMSRMVIYINYMRKDGVFGCCLAENVTVDENDDKIMHFTWTVSQNVTLVEGKLSWLVCVKKTNDEGNEENHWNSELCDEMYVSEGLECVETVLAAYPDLITQLLLRMRTVEEMITEFAFIDDGNGNVTIQGVGISINFAEAYTEGKKYSVGDYCSYVGIMYKCNTEILLSEPFNPNHWDRVNVADELKKCFQSVADGKRVVASAITDMKVTTDATASFATMAANIRSIKRGQGNAQPVDVTKGKTFTNDEGNLLTGTSTAQSDLVVMTARYNTLSKDYNVAVTERNNLQNAYNTLNTSYTNVNSAYESLRSSNNVLQINYNNLVKEKTTLQEQYNQLQAQYDKIASGDLTSALNQLQERYNELYVEHNTLQDNFERLSNNYSNALLNYNSYRTAVIEGLANSSLGVTTSTSPSELKAKLLAAFPGAPSANDIFANGSLGGGATISNMILKNGELFAHVGVSEMSSEGLTATVSNIDVSSASKLTFKYAVAQYVYFGEKTLKYGIDNAATSVNLDSVASGIYDGSSRKYQSVTIDVSSLTGKHALTFAMNVESKSSEYPAELDIYISEIKLS